MNINYLYCINISDCVGFSLQSDIEINSTSSEWSFILLTASNLSNSCQNSVLGVEMTGYIQISNFTTQSQKKLEKFFKII